MKTVFVIGGKFLTINFVFSFYIDLIYFFIETFSSKLRFLRDFLPFFLLNAAIIRNILDDLLWES